MIRLQSTAPTPTLTCCSTRFWQSALRINASASFISITPNLSRPDRRYAEKPVAPLIAGTNRDLSVLVKEGKSREDLLARINLWTFKLPGLRDRIEDIEPNLNYELEQ